MVNVSVNCTVGRNYWIEHFCGKLFDSPPPLPYDKGRYHIRNMNGGLVPKRDQELTTGGAPGVPVVVMAAGKKAALRFIEFFTANIRNPNTRRAYNRACCDFFRWCESR